MYMRELDTFIAVAELGSFMKASEKLFLTPASVMNQINKLEKLVGAKLIERSNHGTSLTAAGNSFYDDAKQMIERSEASISRARKIAESEQNIIRVGTSIMRPCKPLIDLWSEIDSRELPFQINIVPFDDDPEGLENVLSDLGNSIDCFIGPCDSIEWSKKYNILKIDELPCRVAVPRKHPLYKKEELDWSDLNHESFMMVRRGDSTVLNQMRDDIQENHPDIRIVDVENFYDTSIFNESERMNYLMETLDIWENIHPSLITKPINWDYKIPYGIIYSKYPSETVETFIKLIENRIPSN